MKRAELVDIFENLVRASAMLSGSMSHIPQSQAREQCFDAGLRIGNALCDVRRELKK